MLHLLQLIFRFDGDGTQLYAVAPGPKWGTGDVNYDPVSGAITAKLDDGETIKGDVNLSICSDIKWTTPPNVTWLKLPQLKNVHVVFMNHLDVGYNGIPKIGFVINVLNTYFMEYFPRAVKLAFEMDNVDPDSGFIYTTHTWLLKLYLNCPKDFVLNNLTLYCPSPEEVEAMEDALKKGHVTWHSGPMNMQVEFMNSALLSSVLKWNNELNKKYRCCSQVWSLRDVPGLTGAAIPILKLDEYKIKAVSVGVNPGSAPPAVPKLFQWQPFNQSKESIIGIWNPGGYPLNPGFSVSSPGGLSIMDSVISAQDGEALVFAFRTDNSGPPSSLAEIQSTFDVLREQYAGARVFASTLDNFVNSINMSSLPMVYGEIGDTWIQGIASDPLKTALYRAAGNALECSATMHAPNSDYNFLPYLVKLPEHTWGLPSVHSTTNWSNEDFAKIRNEQSFTDAENSWLEQREFFYIVKQMIGMFPHTDIVQCFEEAMKQLELKLPDMDEFTSVDPTATFNTSNGASIAFGKDGSVVHFNATFKDRMFSFADKSHPLGLFTYHTYNESDFMLMNSQYDYYGNAGYDKPNSTASAHPRTAVYRFPMTGLYRNNKNDSIFLVKLEGDPTAHSYYGGPEKVWIQVQVVPKDPASSSGELLDLSFEVIWMYKTATRLAEATMFSFLPALQDRDGRWQDRLYKVSPPGSPYFHAENFFSVFSVVKNGSFYQHAVEQVNLVEHGKFGDVTLGLKSLEVPLVCPIFSNFDSFHTPTPFPYLERPGADSVDGFAFNLHNNIWNTNYPLWYPYVKEETKFRAKFNMIWYEEFQ